MCALARLPHTTNGCDGGARLVSDDGARTLARVQRESEIEILFVRDDDTVSTPLQETNNDARVE